MRANNRFHEGSHGVIKISAVPRVIRSSGLIDTVGSDSADSMKLLNPLPRSHWHYGIFYSLNLRSQWDHGIWLGDFCKKKIPLSQWDCGRGFIGVIKTAGSDPLVSMRPRDRILRSQWALRNLNDTVPLNKYFPKSMVSSSQDIIGTGIMPVNCKMCCTQ
jgi:hypothetical protein